MIPWKKISRRNWILGAVVFWVVVTVTTWPKTAERAGAPLLSGAQVPPAVMAILDRSCRDCHSESTRYPWYSYIAPSSFLIESDVSGGRRHVNLSRWAELPLVRKQRSLSEIANQVTDGGMPLYIYTVLHPDAKLSPSDVKAIFDWTQAERNRLITESAGR